MQLPLVPPRLEDFEGCSEARAIELIVQYASAPSAYHFGELLALPAVEKLKNSANGKPYHDLLMLFAYGTYETYTTRQDLVPLFNDSMLTKLRQLSIVSLAAQSNELPFSLLFEKLGFVGKDRRVLEDLIIDAVYNNLMTAKIDQEHDKLLIKHCIGREVPEIQLTVLLSCLNRCVDICDKALDEMEKNTALLSVQSNPISQSDSMDDVQV